LRRNISFLELFPIVVALCLWGNSFANKNVIFHIDNQAVVTIIYKQTSKDPNIKTLMRRLVLVTLEFNVLIKAEHIPGYVSLISDSVSRCQLSRFLQLAPDADQLPIKRPSSIWEI
jgi:hypothetical protein